LLLQADMSRGSRGFRYLPRARRRSRNLSTIFSLADLVVSTHAAWDWRCNGTGRDCRRPWQRLGGL